MDSHFPVKLSLTLMLQAAKDRLAAERESFNHQASMSRARRGSERNQEFGPDGWAAAGRIRHMHAMRMSSGCSR